MDRTYAWLRIPITRRSILKSAAAMGAASALPSVAWSAEGKVLKARTYADIKVLDPAHFLGVVDEEIMGPIYNKLINYKSGGKPGGAWDWQLEAAASIEQVDPTHIKFVLKPGIMFDNGFGEMTADDVKFSFERIVDPATESTMAPDWGPLGKVEVMDAYTGVIAFDEPFPPVWNITLPYSSGNIVSRKAVEAAGGRIGTEPPCVSGPYRIKEWRPKQKHVLEVNPMWSGPKPDFDEIHIFKMDDEKTAELAFDAGDIDFTRVSLSSLGRYDSDMPDNSSLHVFPSLYYVWVGMNLDHPALQDRRLRQAIQHAIDVPSILEAAYFGAADASTGLIAPGLTGHRPQSLVPPAADFDKARQLMAEAGLSDGVTLTLDVLNKSTNVAAAQVIQATLATVGVEVEVNLHEGGAFWTLGDESSGERWKDVQLILNRFSMVPDPYYATTWWQCGQVGVWNWERYCNEEYDKIDSAASSETDPAKRQVMYEKLQDMLEDSGAFRFVTHEASPVIYRDTLVPALRPDGLPIYRYFKRA